MSPYLWMLLAGVVFAVLAFGAAYCINRFIGWWEARAEMLADVKSTGDEWLAARAAYKENMKDTDA